MNVQDVKRKEKLWCGLTINKQSNMSEKTIAKFIEPNANLCQIGRKFDNCDCIVIDKNDSELIVELCEYHSKTTREGSIKYISPCIFPVKPLERGYVKIEKFTV